MTTFPSRLQARVRGAVRGALTPLSVPGLAKALQLDAGGGGVAGTSLGSLIEQLAAAGEVDGSLRGGGSTWVPAVHARAQQESVLSFFRSAIVSPPRVTVPTTPVGGQCCLCSAERTCVSVPN